MKLSLNWLREFVNIPLIDKPWLHDIIVGHVLEVKKHENADKLNIAQVDIGGGQIQEIVCGANNLKTGQKVPVALPGVTLPGNFTIETRAVRGVISNGMICSKDELGLTKDRAEGIMILDNKWQTGTPLTTVLQLEGFAPKQLAHLITIRTAEVESIDMHNEDYILDIDNKSITHRPDLWGHYGFAHELSTILSNELTPYKTDVNFPNRGPEINVKIKDKDICRRFCCAIIEGVTIEPSPEWLQNKLLACGINPINNIVDITNYVMLELGHPMHAFDRQQVKTDQLVIKYAEDGEVIELLDNKKYTLTSEDPIITNGEEFLSLAGIMGGLKSGINDQTTSIILEAANWHPAIIRRSSTRTGIRSDASQRFEKSLDPIMAQIAIEKATELVSKLCPSAKIHPLTDEWTVDLDPITIELSYEQINNYIGIEIDPIQVKQILDSLGFIIAKEEQDILTVEVPSWRATKDVSIAADLIEEVARIYGYENIPAISPHLPATPPETNQERHAEHDLRQILQGLGGNEVYNYSFYSEKDFNNALLKEDIHFKLKNYLAETQSHLRASMTPNFLHSIHTNLKYHNEFTIFELGRTYKNTGEFFPAEEKKIIIGCVHKSKKQQKFFEAKGIAEEVLSQYLEEFTVQKSTTPLPYAHPEQCAEILFDETKIGYIFNVHPLVKQNFDLANASISIVAINIGHLLNHKKPTTKFTELPKFPDLEFDVSVIVPEEKTVQELESAIKNAAPELINNIKLFDIYRGENVEKGHKSIAYSITLRNLDRTLTDEDMSTVQAQVFTNLKKLGGQIRGQ